MHAPYEFSEADDSRIVYVRKVDVDDLPEDQQEQAEGALFLYAVHASDGERLALVKERNLAFILARQNDFKPVTAH